MVTDEVTDQMKCQGRDIVPQFGKLITADVEKYSLFLLELERHLENDEESLQLAEDLKSSMFICLEIENESNKCL